MRGKRHAGISVFFNEPSLTKDDLAQIGREFRDHHCQRSPSLLKPLKKMACNLISSKQRPNLLAIFCPFVLRNKSV